MRRMPKPEATVDLEALGRLREVMLRLREECPWDAAQTHESLVSHLIEEACETVEAIESGDDAELTEELGDLLLQVFFHARIAANDGRFTLADVADRIADKLIFRHPYVFSDAEVPSDLLSSWEQKKRVEKQRSSALDGIPDRLSALSRIQKVHTRAKLHGLPVEPGGIAGTDYESQLAKVISAGIEQGIDVEQTARRIARALEAQIRETEG